MSLDPKRWQRAKRLLHEGLEKKPDEREQFVRTACGDDQELREEVLSLLDAFDAVGSVSRNGVGPESAVTRSVGSPFPPPETPEHVGPYKILEALGEGGMGTVFVAEQTEPVRRKVALKVIKLGMDTKQVVARFEAERQALALMNHPNIAKVLDAGTTPEGRLYFAMEYIPGIPITEYCDRHRLEAAARLEQFVQVCQAIQHAHQKGIIHRDIKPSNILVSLQDGEPVPKVIDFGIAKATSLRLTEKSYYTQHGMMIGTPAYMSPEQAEMTGLDVDATTDIYSLGVLLYELLVGALPFSMDTLRTAGFDEMRRILREDDPPTPSSRFLGLEETAEEVAKRRQTDVRSLHRRLKGDLDWIVMKSMEKDRSRRYDSAAELAIDVGRHLRHEPVLASPPSTAYRAAKFVRRHRVVVLAGMLVAAALLVGLAGTLIGLVRARAAEELALEQAASAATEAAEAKAIGDFLREILTAPDPLRGLGRDVTVLDALVAGAARVDTSFVDQPETEAAVRHTIGRTFAELAYYDEAQEQFLRALEARKRLLGLEHSDTAETLVALADLAKLKGDFDIAQDRYREAIGALEALVDDDHDDLLYARNSLAILLRQLGEYEEAEELYRTVLDGYRRQGDRLAEAILLNNIGTLVSEQRRLAEAEQLLRESLAIYEEIGESGPVYGDALGNLANTLHRRALDLGPPSSAELLAEGESLLRDALPIFERAYGDEHPGVAAKRSDLGILLVTRGDLQAAEALFIDALTVLREKAPGSYAFFLARSSYGECLTKLGRFEEAESELLAAYSGYLSVVDEDHRFVQFTMQRLVRLYEAWGRPDDAAAFRAKLAPSGSDGA